MIPIVTNNFVDLQERNIILGIEDDSILEEFERSELRHPSPRKVDGDGTIYKSRSLVITKNPGRPVITDFGEARVGQQTYDDDIQPFQYRAPEVIMDMPWSYEVDIWNVGVMVSASRVLFPLYERSIDFALSFRFGICSMIRICSTQEDLMVSLIVCIIWQISRRFWGQHLSTFSSVAAARGGRNTMTRMVSA
jgi:serine/threonine protein kinase